MVEILILIALQVVNGFFSMSEAVLMTANRNRLRTRAEKGDTRAAAAFALAQDPTRFLSTVQIFITLVGIIGGAFGGASLANSLAGVLVQTPLAPYASALGFAGIVLLTTYLSLVIGELTPKRLALRDAENLACAVAPLMTRLARLMRPVVVLLSISTEALLLLLGARGGADERVSHEDVNAVVQQGVEGGVFEKGVAERVQSVLQLQEREVRLLMTPRPDIVYLDLEDGDEINREKLRTYNFSRYPVVSGGIDGILGLVETKDLLARLLTTGRLDVKRVMRIAQFVPENVAASKIVDVFRETEIHAAFVIDEYGGIEGMITVHNLLSEIVGDMEPEVILHREDGSWLLEGKLSVDEFKELLNLEALPGESDLFDTLAGFFIHQLDAIPRTGDSLEWNGFRFEVTRMEALRLAQLMVTRLQPILAMEPKAATTEAHSPKIETLETPPTTALAGSS